MIYLCFILLLVAGISAFVCVKYSFQYRKIIDELKKNQKKNGIDFNGKQDVREAVKELHISVNTEESKKLYENSLEIIPKFIFWLRVLVVVALILCVCIFLYTE